VLKRFKNRSFTLFKTGWKNIVGKSQLIQTEGSILDVSSGSIERDQQGQSNKYNYTGIPLSPINTTANNIDYSIAGGDERELHQHRKHKLGWRL
jgi:hypothetical protein